VRLVEGTDFFNVLNMYSDSPKPFNKISYLKRWGKLVCFASIARISQTLANLLFKDELLCELSKADLILIGHDGNLCCELFWFVLAGNIMHVPVAIYGVAQKQAQKLVLPAGIGRSFNTHLITRYSMSFGTAEQSNFLSIMAFVMINCNSIRIRQYS